GKPAAASARQRGEHQPKPGVDQRSFRSGGGKRHPRARVRKPTSRDCDSNPTQDAPFLPAARSLLNPSSRKASTSRKAAGALRPQPSRKKTAAVARGLAASQCCARMVMFITPPE